MALTSEFMDAVNSGKKTRVRIMLKDIMLIDPSCKSFDEMIAYAKGNMQNLFDEHDGESFSDDKADWTEDYMNQQMVSIVTNFSEERIAFLKKIVGFRYADKIAAIDKTAARKTETTTNVYSNSKTTNSSSSHSTGLNGVQIAGEVVAAVGAVALVGGIVGSNIPVAVVGGIALVGGAATVVVGGKKER